MVFVIFLCADDLITSHVLLSANYSVLMDLSSFGFIVITQHCELFPAKHAEFN